MEQTANIACVCIGFRPRLRGGYSLPWKDRQFDFLFFFVFTVDSHAHIRIDPRMPAAPAQGSRW